MRAWPSSCLPLAAVAGALLLGAAPARAGTITDTQALKGSTGTLAGLRGRRWR